MTNELASATAAEPAAPTAAPDASGGGAAAPAGRAAFEPFSAEAAIAGKGSGTSLPGSVTSQLGAAYGADVSNTRVHTDSAAADRAGAEAFTYGNDVFFGSGKYQPGTPHSDFVLAHEVAHVAQQGDVPRAHLDDAVAQGKVETGPDSDPAEAEASAAASAALSGGSMPVSRGGGGRIRYFKQGDGSASQGGHAFMTENALQNMGLSHDNKDKMGISEVRKARMGNWERDLSQALIPTTKPLMDSIMDILNILAIKDFGRGLQLGEFGGYDPAEHIDNPTDLRANGAFKQGALPEVGDLNHDQMQKEQTDLQDGGTGAEAWADKDDRYNQVYKDLVAKNGGKDFDPSETTAAFKVDESGIPVYMSTSKEMLKRQLKNAARLGRHGNDGRGPRLFSSAAHIMQDYYAHSNFAEIAINILLREGEVEIADETGQVKKYDYQKDFGGRVLSTGIQKLGPDGRTVVPGNMMKNGREVMTTGSFNLTDTIASVLEEVADKWKQLNPFKPGSKEPSELVGACLDYIEMGKAPTDFKTIGPKIAEMVRDIAPVVETIAPVAAKVVEVGGGIASKGVKGAGKVASGGLSVLNWANAKLGGDADYFDDTKKSVESSTGAAADSIDSGSKELADGIRDIKTKLTEFANDMDKKDHVLRSAYEWVHKNVSPLKWLEAAARKLPEPYGTQAGDAIKTGSDKIKAWLEKKLGDLWNDVITHGTEKINAVIAKVRSKTNMQGQRDDGRHQTHAGPKWLPEWMQKGAGWIKDNTWNEAQRALGGVGDHYQDKDGNATAGPQTGIAPKTYNPPSHTQVAKDHNDLSQGASDHAHDGAHDPVSQKEDHDPGHEKPKEDGEEEKGHDHGDHGHVHIGAWLSPIAEGMGTASSRAIGGAVNDGWNLIDNFPGVDKKEPNPAPKYPTSAAINWAKVDGDIDTIVDKWFAHPADCRSTWEGFIKGQLKGARMGKALLRRLQQDLSAKKPGEPGKPGAELSESEAKSIQDAVVAPNQAEEKKHAAAAKKAKTEADKKKAALGDKAEKDTHDEHEDWYGEELREKAHVHGHGDHKHDHDDDHGHEDEAEEHDHEQHPHGVDAHKCGPMCGDYTSHGADAHQCTEHCETKKAA